ncbi:MAG: CoA transferase [Actinomycetota bacterium]|jgi:crotonobetainyl-CoA:carnitine CoA-transferase CaiB-like acyl-CoA transferase|nr:CoA transferase [Actinomycetota bacterium]
MTDEEQTGVLNGVRVVELAMWVAGPSAGGLMSDWGADVIKVEGPGGDPQRNILGALGYGDLPVPGFTLDNRGKRSVELDLVTDEGRDAMEALLETADVFLTNMRPQSLEQFELAPEQVHARHPGLVVTSVTGYGLDGEEAWRPGYDIGAFWARGGIARDLVGREEAPIPVRGGLGDHFTGMTAAAGTMAALVERASSGKGRIVESSLLRTGVWAIGHQIVIQEEFGRLQSARPREISPTPMVNSYQAGDGKWFWLIALEADRHYPGLLAAIARPDLASDERFLDAKLRKDNAEAFVAELDEVFASHGMDHWAARFDEHDVWWSPANSIAEVLEDPQVHASGGFVDVENPDGDTIRSVNSPITFRDMPLRETGPAPRVGEHTAEVLRELGLA